MQKIPQTEPARKILQNQPSRRNQQPGSSKLSGHPGGLQGLNQSLNSFGLSPITPDLSSESSPLSFGFQDQYPKPLPEDHKLVERQILKLLKVEEGKMNVCPIIQETDLKFSKDQLTYRKNLADSVFDTEAAMDQFENLRDSPAKEGHGEKTFPLPDGSLVSVKTHPAPKLTQHLMSIIKTYAGNCFAWFNDKLEFQIKVPECYKHRCVQQAHTWKKEYDAAVHHQMESYIDQKIVRLLDDGEQYYGRAHLNVVAAPGKKLRLTMDARIVNEFFAPPIIELPNVLSPFGIQGQKWYTKIDLSEAFNHIRFTKDFSKWFSFDYRGKTYVWQHMGFGWNLAPAIFQTIIEAFLKHCQRSFQTQAWSYYDDILIVDRNKEDLKNKTQMIYQELERCGFQINKEKSIIEPQEKIEFLGFDLHQEEVRISKSTIDRFATFVNWWKDENTYEPLLKALGIVSWCSIISRNIQNFSTGLHQVIPAKIRATKRLHNEKCSDEVKNLAQTTFDNILDAFKQGIKFCPKVYERTFKIYVDASLSYFFGFSCGNSTQQIACNPKEKLRDIDTLETLAIAYAIQRAPKNCNVIVLSDSNVALYSFMRGTSVNPEIRQIIADTMKHASEKNISFIVERISTKDNKADKASREKIDNKNLTPWINFWQISEEKLSYAKYMKWFRQVREEIPYRTSARALHSLLMSKALKLHAVKALGANILQEHQLFQGDAAKVLKTAVLHYLTYHKVTEDDLKSDQPSIISRIILRLGRMGALSWKEVQQASEGKLSRKMIDDRFFAQRKDKFQVEKEFIDIFKNPFFYDGDFDSVAMNNNASDRNAKNGKKFLLHKQVDLLMNNDTHMRHPSDEGDDDHDNHQQSRRSLSQLSKQEVSSSDMGLHQLCLQKQKGLKEEIEALNKQCHEYLNEIQILQKASEVANEFQSHDDQLQELQKEQDLLYEKIEGYKQMISEKDQKIQIIGKDFESAKNEVQALNQQLTQKRVNQESSLKRDLEKANQEKSEALQAQLALKDQIKSLEDNASKSDQDLQDLQASLKKSQDATISSNNAHDLLNTKLQTVQQQLTKEQQEAKRLAQLHKEALDKLTKEIKTLKLDKSSLQLKVENLESETKNLYQEADQNSQSHKLEIKNLKQQIMDQEKKFNKTEHSLQDQLEKATLQVSSLNSSNKSDSERKQQIYDSENSALAKQLQLQKEEADKYRAVSTDVNTLLQKETIRCKDLEFKLQQAQQKISAHEVAQNQDQVDNLLRDIRTANEALAQQKTKYLGLEVENMRLKSESQSAVEKNKALNVQLQQANQQLQVTIKEKSETASQIQMMEMNNQTLLALQSKEASHALILQEELQEMNQEYVQFVEEAYKRQSAIHNYERYVMSLQGKLKEVEEQRLALIKDLQLQIDQSSQLSIECEKEKGANFTLNKNLSCKDWVVNNQKMLLQHCYQIIEQYNSAVNQFRAVFAALQQSQEQSTIQSLVVLNRQLFDQAANFVPNVHQASPDALQIQDLVNRWFQNDRNVQIMASQHSPQLLSIQTDELMIDVSGTIFNPNAQQVDPTIAVAYDRSDGILDRILQLRQQRSQNVLPQGMAQAINLKAIIKQAPSMPKDLFKPKKVRLALPSISNASDSDSPPEGDKKKKKKKKDKKDK